MMAINQLIARSGAENYERIRKGFYQRPEEKQANRLRELQLETAEYGLESQKQADQIDKQQFMVDQMTKGADFVLSGATPEEKAGRYARTMDYFDKVGLSTPEMPRQYSLEVERNLQMFQSKVKAASPTGKLAQDLKRGVITQEQYEQAATGKQTTTEFERLLATSDKSEAEKDLIREQRLAKLTAGSGFAIAVGADGEVTMVSGGGGELTKAQKGKARNAFINKTIQARKFVKLSNRVMQSVGENASQLGVVGAIARLGDEVKSIAKNVSSEFGVDVSGVSNNAGDYNFGSLASESAAFKTNALSLALIFASASGLGEGRALTNKDVQRAIDAIGASTNSPEQLISRIGAVQQNLQESLQIEAEERKYEFGGIPEISQPDIPSKQAIQIREDFRSGKITREQAKEKLNALGGK